MTALAEILFPAPATRSAAAIFRWWERRRLHYNVIVGTTGLFSLGLVELLRALPPAAPQLPPVLPVIVVYGTLANMCYCAGPMVEFALEKLWPRKLLPVGPSLFRMGLTFSVGLTLFPALLMGLHWIGRLLMWFI
jgi:hypothetical protein